MTDQRYLGHDATLQGWPWVDGTYSWMEPTAINVLALRSADQAAHSRCREATKMLLDRQLPEGGWNYGNTTVLGHVLRPHIQSTGLALAALADETAIRPKVSRSVEWLEHALSANTTTTPRSVIALLGLLEHRVWPKRGRQMAFVGLQRNLLRGRVRLTMWRYWSWRRRKRKNMHRST